MPMFGNDEVAVLHVLLVQVCHAPQVPTLVALTAVSAQCTAQMTHHLFSRSLSVLV